MTLSTKRRTRSRSRRSIAAALAACLSFSLCGFAGIANADPVDKPSEDDIASARAQEDVAKLSVAQIEVELASVKAQSQDAMVKAQVAGEAYAGALAKLDEAKAAAEKAKADATKARADFDQGRKDLGAVALSAYRSGGTDLDKIAPFVNAEGMQDVVQRQAALDSVSNAADTAMQKLTALEQVADLMDQVSAKAEEDQQAATSAAEEKLGAAEAAASSAQQAQASVEARRGDLVAELAKRQNTTVELVEKREAALEAERQEAARLAAIAAAEEARRQAEAEAEAQRQAEAAAAAAAEAAADDSSWEDDSWDDGSSGGGGGYWEPEPSYTPPAASGSGQALVDWARGQFGWPYVWGGTGPSWGGYDCSGLTSTGLANYGVYVNRTASDQYYNSGGTSIPLDSIEPGDLLFWGDYSGVYHVAIYSGGGMMIHAPTFGDVVREASVYYSNIMPYAKRFM